MSSAILKRSLAIAGHHTSISLEAPFWDGLRHLARGRGISLAALVAEIDAGRQHGNLSSAIRLHVLDAAKAGRLTVD
jgi:predicted DNA-binding ribbon-helix-helix protein